MVNTDRLAFEELLAPFITLPATQLLVLPVNAKFNNEPFSELDVELVNVLIPVFVPPATP